MQDLVRVRVANACDGPLIFENSLQLCPARLGQQASKCGLIELIAEWIRTQGRDHRYGQRVRHDIDSELALRSRLGEVKTRRIVQPYAQRKGTLARLRWRIGKGVTPTQPAGSCQMEDQMQTLGGNVEELAAPGHRFDLHAVQCRQR